MCQYLLLANCWNMICYMWGDLALVDAGQQVRGICSFWGGIVVMNYTLDEEVWSLEPEVPKFGTDWKMEFCMWEEKVEAGVAKPLWKRREM